MTAPAYMVQTSNYYNAIADVEYSSDDGSAHTSETDLFMAGLPGHGNITI